MGKRSSVHERLDVVLVDDESSRAITPMEGSDQWLTSPEGSVTVDDIRRAARRVRRERTTQDVRSIAQATLGQEQ
ncbi:MAG: hypothetical protein KGY78_02055 [Anaerolineae bacterium]|nr:hypothetical protein [Anaerolineae bacterium]